MTSNKRGSFFEKDIRASYRMRNNYGLVVVPW